MANVLYDVVVSSGRLPPSGSLREALLLTVWLRRQEIELAKVRVFASGFSDHFAKDNKGTVDAYKEFVSSIFPFTAKQRVESDKKLVEAMQQEAQRGVLHFSAATLKPIQKAAKNYSVPEEFKAKMRDSKSRGGLKK